MATTCCAVSDTLTFSSRSRRLPADLDETELRRRLIVPSAERVYYVLHALSCGHSIEELYELTKIDAWFLDNLRQIIEREQEIARESIETITRDQLREAKRQGFSDQRLAALMKTDEKEVRRARNRLGARPVFKRVDTCGAEFESFTPYLYSTYEDEDEAATTDRKKVMILGSGPNRIGQGIEFDYCCCHAAFALKEEGYESIMVNCNLETVSTDYDTSDRLYFEPITFEDVMEIVERERPRYTNNSACSATGACIGASRSARHSRDTTYTYSLLVKWLTLPTFSPCKL